MIRVTLSESSVYEFRDVEHVKRAAAKWGEVAMEWEPGSEERKRCQYNQSRLVVLASRLESGVIDGDALIRG